MEFRRQDIYYEGKDEWKKIVPLGDSHIGNSGCDMKALKDMVDWIKSKDDVAWVGMGDYIDAINYSDPRFDPKTISSKYMIEGNMDKIIQMQINDLVDLLEPIKDKCIGLLRGNHEETIRKHYHYDVLYEMAKDLELPRNILLYDTAIIRLRYKRKNSMGKSSHCFDILCAHGNVGGRSYGYKANRVQDLHKYFLADIYLLAHSHIKQAQLSNLIYFNTKGTMCKKKIVDAYTGCFLQAYKAGQTCYAEKGLFPPTDIGVIKIQIQPEHGDIHVSI